MRFAVVIVCALLVAAACGQSAALTFPSPTEAPPATASPTPAPTAVLLSTVPPTVAPSPTPTATPTQSPTATPSATATPTATASATSSPTIAPTVAPTVAPTPAPTVAPTPIPTPTLTVAPTPVPTPTPTPVDPSQAPTGYSLLSVTTVRGTFTVHLIKERLSQVTMRTITANATSCPADCPVKPLEQYMTENAGYAGMNGTYLCPPDYSYCAGKVNSYDYAVYNSNLRTWLNKPALVGQNSLVTFNGATTPVFYRRSFVYGQSTSLLAQPITAAVSMFPLLVQNGALVDSEFEQTDQQKLKGTKGSIGSDGTFVYLALVLNANITDSTYVLQALGEKNAMNMDGGGTSAMYFGGGYKVGPGRLLPNAVVLTKP